MPERVEGVIIHGNLNQHCGYCFVETNAQTFYVKQEDVEPVNGHICFYQAGAMVTLFPDGQAVKKGHHPRAIGVRLLTPPDLLDKEESIVTVWNGQFGWAQRDPCGCSIFVSKRNIISVNAALNGFGKDTRILHECAASQDVSGAPKFEAVNVEVFI